MTLDPRLYFVHVGKTGGTALKRCARSSLTSKRRGTFEILDGRVVLLRHISLAQARRKFGPVDHIAFSFREPTERFVSGFYCRARMGQPEHNSPWDADEAAAFGHFRSANLLAESLSSADDITRSAAVYAMNAIRHLRRGYVFHFGKSVDFLAHDAARVTACIDSKNLKRDGAAFLHRIGVEDAAADALAGPRSGPSYPRELSPRAVENLRQFWAAEYEYYAIFQELERALR